MIMCTSDQPTVEEVLAHYQEIRIQAYCPRLESQLFSKLLLSDPRNYELELVSQMRQTKILSVYTYLQNLLDFCSYLRLPATEPRAQLLSALAHRTLARYEQLLELKRRLSKFLYTHFNILQNQDLFTDIFRRWLRTSAGNELAALVHSALEELAAKGVAVGERLREQVFKEYQLDQLEGKQQQSAFGCFDQLFVDMLWMPKRKEGEFSQSSQKYFDKMQWLNSIVACQITLPEELRGYTSYFNKSMALVEAQVASPEINALKPDRLLSFFSALLQRLICSEEEHYKKPLRKVLLQLSEFVKGIFANCLNLYLHMYDKETSLSSVCEACEVNLIDFWKFINALALLDKDMPRALLEDYFFVVEREVMLLRLWDQDYFHTMFRKPHSSRPIQLTEDMLRERLVEHLKFRIFEFNKKLGDCFEFDRLWGHMQLLVEQCSIFRRAYPDQVIVCLFYVCSKHDELGLTFSELQKQMKSMPLGMRNLGVVGEATLKEYYNEQFLNVWNAVGSRAMLTEPSPCKPGVVPTAFLNMSPMTKNQ